MGRAARTWALSSIGGPTGRELMGGKGAKQVALKSAPLSAPDSPSLLALALRVREREGKSGQENIETSRGLVQWTFGLRTAPQVCATMLDAARFFVCEASRMISLLLYTLWQGGSIGGRGAAVGDLPSLHRVDRTAHCRWFTFMTISSPRKVGGMSVEVLQLLLFLVDVLLTAQPVSASSVPRQLTSHATPSTGLTDLRDNELLALCTASITSSCLIFDCVGRPMCDAH